MASRSVAMVSVYRYGSSAFQRCGSGSQLGAVGELVVGGGVSQVGLGDGFPVGVGERDAGRDGIAAEGCADVDHGTIRVELCGGEVVENRRFRALQQVDIAEDPARAELVLVLKVRAHSPLEDEDRQPVRPGDEQVGHVELAGGVGDLAVANVAAVQPHVVAGIDSLEVEVDPGRVRVRRVVEIADVGAAGILLGHVRGVERDRVADVGVLVGIEAQVLPHAGHGHLAICVCQVITEVELLRHVIGALEVLEPPWAVEHLEPVRLLPIPNERPHGPGCRDVVRPSRQDSYVHDLQVLVMTGGDHGALRCFLPDVRRWDRPLDWESGPATDAVLDHHLYHGVWRGARYSESSLIPCQTELGMLTPAGHRPRDEVRW